MLLSLDYGYLQIVGAPTGHALHEIRVGRELIMESAHFTLQTDPFVSMWLELWQGLGKIASDRSTSLARPSQSFDASHSVE